MIISYGAVISETFALVLPTLSLSQMHDFILNCNVCFTKWRKI